MAVFRVERNKGYTVMSNHHLRNKELSEREKALFRRQDLPINYGHSAVLAALSGVFALCLYFVFTSLMTMMSS